MILRILLEIFPFPKLKGQNTKHIEGQRDFFSIFNILQRLNVHVIENIHDTLTTCQSLYLKPSLSWSKDSQGSVTFQKT